MQTDLTTIAIKIRRDIIELAADTKCPHVASALSCVDILATLYFSTLNLQDWNKRDIFILSKAHAAIALYCTLYEKGIIDRKILAGFFKNNGTLPAHLDKTTAKGIEVSAGSLGHGFNMGLGWAHGFKKRQEPRKVYTLIGDGETQEGSIWEGAMLAPKLEIDNFTALIDRNNLQGYGRADDICHFEPLEDKWLSFGWHVIRLDGHNHNDLELALKEHCPKKPKVIICDTTKGKGVSFMEDQLVWHYYIVTEVHKTQAFEELK